MQSTTPLKSVRTLAEVLGDEEGRAFVCIWDTEMCIEILDHVGRTSHFFSFTVLDGFWSQ